MTGELSRFLADLVDVLGGEAQADTPAPARSRELAPV